MTFREKIERERPNKIDNSCNGGVVACPRTYGYEKEYWCGDGCEKNDRTCEECWNREMPNTEPKMDNIPVIPQAEVEAHQKGYENGYVNGLENGRNEVWKLVKTLYDMSVEKVEKIFHETNGHCVIRNYTPQEALAKLKAYEEAQEIKEGDIVDIFGNRAVVTSFGTDNMIIHVVYADGITNTYRKDRKGIKKTGKHIDIQSILEQIGE